MTDQIEGRILTLYSIGDRWHAKGMYEIAEIYYSQARKLEDKV